MFRARRFVRVFKVFRVDRFEIGLRGRTETERGTFKPERGSFDLERGSLGGG